MLTGTEVPSLRTELPGPLSREAVTRLIRFESAGISGIVKGAKPIFWRAARGAAVLDIDGNTLVDCTSSFGVSTIGYSHPRVVEQLQRQADHLAHSMAGIFPHEPYVQALESICGAVGRWPHTQAILTTSGSEAVEVALKLAYRATGKPGVISFFGSFHGQLIGALGVTSHAGLRDPLLPFVSRNTVFVPYPDAFRPPFGADAVSGLEGCLTFLRRVLKHDTTGGLPIGAVLVEPIQNASGYILPAPGFLRAVRALCDEFGALLIADEIFTGFGRLGEWLACDADEVVPDVVCVGKGMTGGLPIAACLADIAVMTPFESGEIVPLHGSTFMANPLACVAASVTIEVLREERLVHRARVLGPALLQQIRDICAPFPFIGEVRGRGMAIAIDFVQPLSRERLPDAAWKLSAALLAQGIVTLVTALPFGNVLAICPPFCITDAQVECVLAALQRALATYSAGL